MLPALYTRPMMLIKDINPQRATSPVDQDVVFCALTVVMTTDAIKIIDRTKVIIPPKRFAIFLFTPLKNKHNKICLNSILYLNNQISQTKHLNKTTIKKHKTKRSEFDLTRYKLQIKSVTGAILVYHIDKYEIIDEFITFLGPTHRRN